MLDCIGHVPGYRLSLRENLISRKDDLIDPIRPLIGSYDGEQFAWSDVTTSTYLICQFLT